jgi:hypothetical protein
MCTGSVNLSFVCFAGSAADVKTMSSSGGRPSSPWSFAEWARRNKFLSLITILGITYVVTLPLYLNSVPKVPTVNERLEQQQKLMQQDSDKRYRL